MTEIKIRPATPDDASSIADIHIKSWRSAYEGIISQDYLDTGITERITSESWEERLLNAGSNRTFLAVNGERLAGFATGGPSRDQNYSGYGELYAIYLDPTLCRKGVGTLLLREAAAYIVGCGFQKMFVDVFVDNAAGRRFYEQNGAVPVLNSEAELIIGGKPVVEMRYEWKSLTFPSDRNS